MKHPRALLLTSLSVPALVAFTLPETSLVFGVKDGATSAKTFKSSIQLTLDDMKTTINGQDPPMMPEMEMTLATEFEAAVSDEYVEMGAGAPKQLKRTYDKLSMHTDMSMEMEMMGNSQNQETPMTFASELQGKTVVFKLDEESGEYDATFPDEEGDAELLADLTEDMDLRGFLPPGAVSEGDSWDVAPSELAQILAPGGNLKLMPEDMEDMGIDMMQSNFGSMSDWFTDQLKGEVKGTFTGVREEEGAKYGVIQIQIDITNAVDLTEMVEAAMEEIEMPPEAGDIDFDHMDLELEFEGEGTLLWNLDFGQAHSLELSGDFGLLMNMGMAMSGPGMEMDIENTMEMSGTMNESATFE